jgi:hypothetical protein
MDVTLSKNRPPIIVVSKEQRQKLRAQKPSEKEIDRIYHLSEKHSIQVAHLGSHLGITVHCPVCCEIYDALWANASHPYEVKYYMGKAEFEVSVEDLFDDGKIVPLVKKYQTELSSAHHEHKDLPYED